MKIKIEDATIRERTTKSGKTEYIQNAWAFLDDQPYPTRINLYSYKREEVYKIGTYELCSSSIVVSRFGTLEFKRVLELNEIKE